jgi:hypothetical protein
MADKSTYNPQGSDELEKGYQRKLEELKRKKAEEEEAKRRAKQKEKNGGSVPIDDVDISGRTAKG